MRELSLCPGVEAWRRFHAGDVSDEELDSLGTHQENCESCRARLASFDAPHGQGSTIDFLPTRGREADIAFEVAAGFEVEAVLGEGGMGRVWVAREAEVGRYVALKQLRPDHEGDFALRERFLAEARVTGQLEHPGIVPVYRVFTRADGSPAYAMRLIRGKTLLEAVREHHQRDRHDRMALRELLQAFVSVCQTLAYAHSRGVIHRDLKGENIVLGPFGEVLVLDWGLAKVRGGGEGPAVQPLPVGTPDETADGAIAGTPAYMPPEQARGEPADARSDVFGLGAVLYLILTGRPLYPAENRFGALVLAAEARVTPPGRLARGVPRALEAVCLKAMAREPAGRYQGVAELADEVKHWLAGEPVSACPEPVLARAGRWVKRHRVVSGAAAAALLVALFAGGGFAWQEHGREQVRLAQRRDREREAEGLLAKAEGGQAAVAKLEPALAKVQFNHALGFAERAAGVLREGDDSSLRRRVEAVRAELRQAERDQEMVLRIEQARLQGARVAGADFDSQQIAREYRTAFAWYLDAANPHSLSTQEVAERLRGRPIAAELVAALNDWSNRRPETKQGRDWARGVASLLDDDPHRRQIRDLLGKGHVKELAKLARTADLSGQPAATLAVLGAMLIWAKQSEDAERVLRLGQQAYPGDFWLNHYLGLCLAKAEPPRTAEAVRFLTAAAALRSLSAGTHANLGAALNDQGRHQEAERALRHALKLKTDNAIAHLNLGISLSKQGRHKEAEQACRHAIKFNPDYPEAHNNLGNALNGQKRPREAEQAYRQAVKLKPNFPLAHYNLGATLCDLERLKEAEQASRHAIKFKADYPEAHYNLGISLSKQGRHKEAEQAYRHAIKLKPDYPEAYVNLGVALNDQGRHQEAEQALRNALKLKPNYADACNNLGYSLKCQGKDQEAEQAYRSALKLNPDLAQAHSNLGVVLGRRGRHKEAEQAHRHAIKLKPDFAEAHYNLGTALGAQGRVKEAEQAYRHALKLKPDDAEAHGNLGVALIKQGLFKDALKSFRLAATLFPSGSRDRQVAQQFSAATERMIELDAKLTEVLAGKALAGSPPEKIRLADLARQPYRAYNRTAASLYADAFAARPRLADQHRYNAACCAALAGTGQGKDADQLDADDRANLRYGALSWLHADLGAHADALAGSDAKAADTSRKALLHWKQDSDLAAVRDREALAKLPESEQTAWANLWARVDRLLAGHRPDR